MLKIFSLLKLYYMIIALWLKSVALCAEEYFLENNVVSDILHTFLSFWENHALVDASVNGVRQIL